ncbi:class I SAM-dependent methyltransferase [Nocardia salmonicida]|uniref:class I SAM-dependent methyltransferase n=1 Tax=Nocardia TaxID=1817 RepID=UPI002657D319|nr:class I SAM-dependent methyltransferase [Nocardia sp. PE-7]WKG12414.1 class I SAM-dependent methyltransferase [Nocardia sp. PE-7]
MEKAYSGYDRTGTTYSRTRRPDPRIATFITDALSDTESVANIGAGAGSYEPAQTVVAIEPSSVMISQRPREAAEAVRGVAEQLPLGSASVDAALAVLTVHHWHDVDRGLAEMVRIARRRIAILTWDPEIFQRFWLLRDYLPAAADTDARLAVPMSRLTALPGKVSITPIPVPHDCVDGFGGAFWRRPHLYLDPTVQAGMSMLALTPPRHLDAGLSLLTDDLTSGRWASRYASLATETEFDVGYRLVVADY